MKAHTITTDKNIEPIEIGHKMHMAGLPYEFVAAAVRTAFEFEGNLISTQTY